MYLKLYNYQLAEFYKYQPHGGVCGGAGVKSFISKKIQNKMVFLTLTCYS